MNFQYLQVQIDSPGWYDRQGLCDVKEMVDTPSARRWLNLVAKDCFEWPHISLSHHIFIACIHLNLFSKRIAIGGGAR